MVGIYFPFIFTLFYEETAKKLGFLAQKRIRRSDGGWYYEVNEYCKRWNRTNLVGNGWNNLLHSCGPFVSPFHNNISQIDKKTTKYNENLFFFYQKPRVRSCS